MSSSANIRLYATHPHQCSYLEDRQATTVFVDPDAKMDGELYSALSELGFRRSGKHVYRPHCQQCSACVPVRVRVRDFAPNRSQKRCLKHNHGLRLTALDSIDSDACYALYDRYIAERHAGGDMFPPSRSQYQSFLTSEWQITRYLAAYEDDQLVGVAVTDQLNSGLSAVYTFFEPDQPARSLGVFFILKQIEWALELGLPYLYLGYWIGACQKMRYKTQYQPLEQYRHGLWQPFREN